MKIYDNTMEGIRSQIERDQVPSVIKEKTGEISDFSKMDEWLRANTPQKVWKHGHGVIFTANNDNHVFVHVMWNTDGGVSRRKDPVTWTKMWANPEEGGTVRLDWVDETPFVRALAKSKKEGTVMSEDICSKCGGSGIFTFNTGAFGGPCFACKGKGAQEVSDQMRNKAYWEHRRQQELQIAALEEEEMMEANEDNNYGHSKHCPLVPCICAVADEREIKRIVISGHRLQKLGGYDLNNPLNVKVFNALEAKMVSAVNVFAEQGIGVLFNIGMAIGVDQMAARICIKQKQDFDAYIPCKGQESPWPKHVQDEYRKMLTFARKQHITHEGPYPGAWVLQRRNEQMIDGADGIQADYLIAVYDGTASGTGNCVAYARSKGVKCAIINPREL